jgi:hypothetical protein
MTPQERIGRLDQGLARVGQRVQLQRTGSTTDPTSFSATADCQAQVISVGINNSQIIISPTDLLIAPFWPGVNTNPADVGDLLLPRKTDKILVNGMQRQIQNVHPRYVDSVLVRVEIEASA